MIVFDPFYLLLLIFFIDLLPGILLSLAILREKQLLFIEKIIIGCVLGFVIPPLALFILGLLGILYSFKLAIAITVLFYILAIYLFITKKPWEIHSISKEKIITSNRVLSLVLVAVLLLTFWVRFQSYSPIFYELDPYFYLNSATHILQDGIPQFDDKTAWYPELKVTHRDGPLFAYLESEWYSFYSSGGAYVNYTLALVASAYPPLAAVFAVFFVYLFVSSVYKREFGIFAAVMASFAPMFLQKTMAGEFEAQPYSFFAIAFFLAFYALAMKSKDKLYAILAALGLVSIVLGASSAILIASVAMIVFIPLQSLLMFFKREAEEIKEFLILNSIILSGLIFSQLLLGWYQQGSLISSYLYPLIGVLFFSLLMYVLKLKIEDQTRRLYFLIGIFILGLLAINFTPFGGYFKSMGANALGIAQFNEPLSRTIAEQGQSGSSFESFIGWVGYVFREPISYFTMPFSILVNALFKGIIAFFNSFFGSNSTFSDKDNSMIHVIFFFFFVSVASSLFREIKNNTCTLSFLLFAVVFFPSLIGLMKTKYSIYMGFFLACAFGIVLGELSIIIPALIRRSFGDKKSVEMYIKDSFYVLLAIGILFSFLQFTYQDFASGLLFSSFHPRFQDDPTALQPKFQEICDKITSQGSYDADICGAAQDPLGYASKGINYQYNFKLCYFSLVSNPFSQASQSEITPIVLKCGGKGNGGIDTFWIEALEWMKNSPDEKMRITSWWDYGHWTNFFGEKNTVLRNEHASTEMIGEVAHDYVDGSEEELKEFMLAHDSEYALFDVEIIIGNGAFGGKYGALNYLSCARDNLTDETQSPGTSICETEHLWETVLVPKTQQYTQECTVSELTGKKGITVFEQQFAETEQGVTGFMAPVYCLSNTTLANGQATSAFYDLNKKYPNGDLKLNKAFIFAQTSSGNTEMDAAFNFYQLYYDKSNIWIENGQLVNGWEDRKGKFYDSNLYKGFMLGELEGFDLVFQSSDQMIKIYKIK